jgi:Cysteine-rich secretory protein family
MLEGGYFGHESPDGTPYLKRLARFYRPGANATRWSVGENLYWSAPQVSAAQAIRTWMQSPRHRINLLQSDWRDVGIAAVRASAAPGAFMGLSVTVLTVDFGAGYWGATGATLPAGACSSVEERRPSKPRVGGSNPSRRIRKPACKRAVFAKNATCKISTML